MWKTMMCGVSLVLALAAPADTMLIYNPTPPGPMLESPEVRAKLASLGTDAGYRVVEANDPAALLAAAREEMPKLLIWGRSEVVEDEAYALIGDVLAGGGMVATGGGSPFYYRIQGDAMVAQGPGVSEALTGVSPVFTQGKSGRIAPYGEFIFGHGGEVPAQVRGGAGVRTPGALWLPLTVDADNPAAATAFVAVYPSGGRYFYYGADGLAHDTLFNPLTEEGAAHWRTLIAACRRPLPRPELTSAGNEFRNDGQTLLTVTLKVKNASAQPLVCAGRMEVAPAEGFGVDGAPVDLGEFRCEIAPGQSGNAVFSWLPPPTAWGVYTFTLRTVEGIVAERSLQLLPPGAVDYIDVDPLYAPLAETPRTLKIGLYSFLDRYEGRLKVTVDNDGGRVLYDAPVTLARTPATVMTVVEAPLGAVGRDWLVHACLTDPAGALIHDSWLRVEAAAANPVLVRRDVMFRAMNGSQFVEEPELPADLEALRDRLPLLRGLYIQGLQGDARQWMREHDFTLNYGLLLTDYPRMGKWGLDDRNAVGRSAVELMPGHPEDPARWLVWQHSRLHFKPVLAAHPEIVNLVEAVAGYQTPGTETAAETAVEGEYTQMSDIIAGRRLPPEEMEGKVSHFLGYAPEAVWRHREALAGRDGGLRILEPGGKRFRRVYLPELYRDLFSEPLPTPEELGISGYDAYEPIMLKLSHENGFFPNDRELKRYQLHYLIRCYFHLKRLDDLGAYLRAFAPEVHCVIGHDGPLVAQLSDVLYRLPYLDTQTRWLFRSAYVMAIDTTFGAERHWVMLGRLYGKRVGIHEEIGGGQWAPYRTAKTSFVSLFTKRAALPYRDLQVDFYHNRNKTYRVAEETAMFRGFQTAVDTGAHPANDAAGLLVVETNNSHYPADYQGNYRWDLMMPPEPILSVPDFLRAAGRYFHSTHTPLFAASELARYHTVWLAAERYRYGDLGIVREWLNSPQPGPRTLILNHVGTLHANYLNGMGMAAINAARPEDWRELGLTEAQLNRTTVSEVRVGDRTFAFARPLPVIEAVAPEGAEVVAADADGHALVWRWAVAPGRNIVYSGLPFNNIFESETDRETLYALGEAALLADPELPRSYAVTPARWFGMGYRLDDGTLAVALINPAEYRVAMSPYGADGDAVEAASAALGETEVCFRWLRATEPHRRFRLIDAWDMRDTGREIVADADGTIELTLPVNTAELYYLR